MPISVAGIVCPFCSQTFKIPLFRAVEAMIIEDGEIPEMCPQEKQAIIQDWLSQNLKA